MQYLYIIIYNIVTIFSGLYDTLPPPPQIWKENGSAYSLNVAYLARWGWGAVAEHFCFFFLFSSFKTTSYSPVCLIV